MTVPTLITDLSTTAASNSPSGSDAVFPDLDNFLRAYGAFIAQLNSLKAPIASPTFTGTVTVPNATFDSTFSISISGGNPSFQADTGDYYYYDRSSNNWVFSIGGADKFFISSSDGPYRTTDAGTNNGLVRKSQMDTADGLRCLKTNNLSDVSSASTALSNLGGVASTSFTGGNQSLAASGFQKIPGGLIIQWGYKTGNSAGFSVTFPTAFPTACVFVAGQGAFLGGGGFASLSLASSPTTTGFSGYMNTTSAAHVADDLYWIALGY